MSCDNPNHPNSCMKDCFIISQETARELLEACKEAVDILDADGRNGLAEDMRQAIAKAEKES